MTINVISQGGVTTIQIARPEKKNALTQAMYRELAGAVSDAERDASIRALLLIGQPEVFSAGNDLEDFQQVPPSLEEAPVGRLMNTVLDCQKPIIAAVNGAAIGIGATILLHCDLVYLGNTAQLAFPFVNLGLVPEFASSLLLPQRIGYARAAQALLLGEPIGAAAAVELGLATAMLPAADVLAHARNIAQRFNSLSVDAVRQTKRLMRSGGKPALSQAMAAENAAFIDRLRSPEVQATLQAFLGRRRAAAGGDGA